MSTNDQCLNEAEILEIASSSTQKEDRLAHVLHCVSCNVAVERARSDLARLRDLFDPTIQARLDSTQLVNRADPLAVFSWPRDQNREFLTVVPQKKPIVQPGAFIGKYRVKRFLGRGGLSEVFLVEHPDLGIDLAAKICRASSLSEASARQNKQKEALLKQEAALLARLANAKHIARVYDLDIDENCGPNVVMEYVAARTLRQRMREFAGNPKNAIELITKIADAVQEAHAEGIVHGDLKPENILVNDRDEVKLIDFGMARIRDAWHFGEDPESHGGTLVYMAPEQANGEDFRIEPASDVFALGAILQELLTSKRPYDESTTIAVHTSVKEGRIHVASRDELPFPWLCEVLQRSLAANPEDRFPTAGIFAAAIRKNLSDRRYQIRWLVPSLVGAALVVVLLSYLVVRPDASHPTRFQPIPGILGAEQAVPGELQKSLPIQVGTRMRLSAVGPKGLEWFVAWIDGQKEITVFATNDQSFPIETQPVGDQPEVRVYWPTPPQEVKIGGTGGTELVLLIGIAKPDATSEDKIRQLIEMAVSDTNSWPPLAHDVLIRCSRDDVQPEYAQGSSRSLDAAEITSRMQIEKSIQQIRQVLRDECEFVLGEAFRVTAL